MTNKPKNKWIDILMLENSLRKVKRLTQVIKQKDEIIAKKDRQLFLKMVWNYMLFFICIALIISDENKLNQLKDLFEEQKISSYITKILNNA
jgi:hypothetical protein